jgi:hypothetical protein
MPVLVFEFAPHVSPLSRCHGCAGAACSLFSACTAASSSCSSGQGPLQIREDVAFRGSTSRNTPKILSYGILLHPYAPSLRAVLLCPPRCLSLWPLPARGLPRRFFALQWLFGHRAAADNAKHSCLAGNGSRPEPYAGLSFSHKAWLMGDHNRWGCYQQTLSWTNAPCVYGGPCSTEY